MPHPCGDDRETDSEEEGRGLVRRGRVMESIEEAQGAGEEEDGAGKDCVLQFTAPLTL